MSNNLKVIQGKQYNGDTITIDNINYKDCVFLNCNLVFNGGPVGLEYCQFDNCKWSFSGHAATTLAFLSKIYSQGSQMLVEQTFDNIRKGKY